MSKLTQPLIPVIPAVVSFDSHVVDIGKYKSNLSWCQKSDLTNFIQEENVELLIANKLKTLRHVL